MKNIYDADAKRRKFRTKSLQQKKICALIIIHAISDDAAALTLGQSRVISYITSLVDHWLGGNSLNPFVVHGRDDAYNDYYAATRAKARRWPPSCVMLMLSPSSIYAAAAAESRFRGIQAYEI